jgi:colicin import membrane protein
MIGATPYSVPKDPGRWRALTLAAVVHAALFAFLWIGIRWQSETPVAVEAEVWSPQLREAAPKPQPEPEPEPAVKPEPKPVIKATPKPAEVEPPVVKPDIALEQEKKRKAQQQKAREEEARLEKQKAEEKRRADEKRAEKEKANALAQDKQKADTLKKEAADKKRKQDLLDQTARDNKAHAEEVKRMMAQAGSGGTGDAPKSQGNRGNADYVARVGAKIKSNTIFNVPDNLAGNPAVEYAVELLPDGSIRRPVRKTKPSGVPGFDEAVLNAIEKSQPYPPDKSGAVPSSFNVVHRPKDQ